MAYNFHEKQMNSQKAISLPSSPRYFTHHASGRCEAEVLRSPDISTLNKILEIPKILNKELLPFEEWNIEFSELTVGTRIGIGMLVYLRNIISHEQNFCREKAYISTSEFSMSKLIGLHGQIN